MLFLLHLLGARPDCVAQPSGTHHEPRDWLSDGAAASLTSLGCMVMLLAARGELEASGRGALHGHWEVWAQTNVAQGHWTVEFGEEPSSGPTETVSEDSQQ